jgi:hypothetical protein
MECLSVWVLECLSWRADGHASAHYPTNTRIGQLKQNFNKGMGVALRGNVIFS